MRFIRAIILTMLPTAYLILLLFLAYTKPAFLGINKQVNAQGLQPPLVLSALAALGIPIRLTIPAINVDAAIEPMGVSDNGTMEVPNSIVNVGWYKLGIRPGNAGSAVIAGHVDGKNGEPGVFARLHELQPGETILVTDDANQTVQFTVRERRTYNPKADATVVFNQTDGKHLNLITCDGTWDTAKKSYDQRLVVFADAQE